jgi:acyl-coenzyme A thioesterase PaaI-like protein
MTDRVPNKTEIIEFLRLEFPQNPCSVEEVGDSSATVKRRIGVEELRPGGTVSGPVLMAVADVALYVAILGEIGIVPLAVTTSFTINFLSKPAAEKSIVGVSRLMKVGRRLVVGEVTLYSEGTPEPVAHAVATYSIPPGVSGNRVASSGVARAVPGKSPDPT